MNNPQPQRKATSATKGMCVHWIVLLSVVVAASMLVFNCYFIWHTSENELRSLSSNYFNHHLSTKQESSHHEEVDSDQELNITSILQRAGVDIPPNKSIPSFQDFTSQYGSKPIMHNLNSCSSFRSSVPVSQRMMGVAGLFNSGTNYLGSLLDENCKIPGRSFDDDELYPFREQVPWGKHNPPRSHRLINRAGREGAITWSMNHSQVLPVVVIKDPFHWTVSNCRHEYFLWDHDDDHCPRVTLELNDEEAEVGEPPKPNSFNIAFPKEKKHYISLIHLWNSWNLEYEQQSTLYPIVYIRFEDLLLHTEHVIGSLCKCMGGDLHDSTNFYYLEESAKGYSDVHSGANGFLESMIRYGNPVKRLEGWTYNDWKYAMDHVDERLMKKFGYRFPSWD
jgi:hypothetical protein